MAKRIFKRKAYQKLLKWKSESNGSTAMLIEGARRVGKSTLALEFAKREYDSFILIDFANISPALASLVENEISNLDYFFSSLQVLTRAKLYRRKSVIIFD